MSKSQLNVDSLPRQMLPVDRICPNPHNPAKRDPQLVRAIAVDQRWYGLHSFDPILTRRLKGKEVRVIDRKKRDLELVDGEQRWLAALSNKYPKIPGRVSDMDESTALALMYRKKREQGSIDSFLEAHFFAHKSSEGLTYRQIADQCLVSEEFVKKRIGLARIPRKIRNYAERKEAEAKVPHGTISPSHWEVIATLHPNQTQMMQTIDAILKYGLSVEETQKRLDTEKQFFKNNGKSMKDDPDITLAAADTARKIREGENAMRQALQGTGSHPSEASPSHLIVLDSAFLDACDIEILAVAPKDLKAGEQFTLGHADLKDVKLTVKNPRRLAECLTIELSKL